MCSSAPAALGTEHPVCLREWRFRGVAISPGLMGQGVRADCQTQAPVSSLLSCVPRGLWHCSCLLAISKLCPTSPPRDFEVYYQCVSLQQRLTHSGLEDSVTLYYCLPLKVMQISTE